MKVFPGLLGFFTKTGGAKKLHWVWGPVGDAVQEASVAWADFISADPAAGAMQRRRLFVGVG
jgi:hypothetical protein